MTLKPETPLGNTTLSRVREGMHVHDMNNKHIGSVRTVYFGADDKKSLERGTGAATPGNTNLTANDQIIDALADVFDPGDMPDVLRNRLQQQGFVRIDTAGLFASDRFATPDQIASVDSDTVHLRVGYDHLIHK